MAPEENERVHGGGTIAAELGLMPLAVEPRAVIASAGRCAGHGGGVRFRHYGSLSYRLLLTVRIASRGGARLRRG
ncbi:hypothetical protein GCM10010324_32010 [Streptomyces hiroshimensis]|uniref:Uncharacterized protein n=1 Tax=Streptomyces hiroshimensis TaxID=66424 RepID=A0ABQ2YHP8_9ACTN|nr:hypothetical protein GCM10010324_32010 [Streptomyces hiroshimensis]